MPKRLIAIDVLAVLLGAVAGTLINAIVVSLFSAADFQTLVIEWGRYVVAVITVALFALTYSRMPPTPAALVSLAIGVLLPAVLDKAVFGATEGWDLLLFFAATFAVPALLVYRAVHAGVKHRIGYRDEPDSTH